MKGKIAEIFESIQGEGIYLGKKQIFVRFYGCNLACEFCDTKLDKFAEYTPQELFDKIAGYPGEHHSVSFTGGEPLLQADFLKEVLKLTKKAGMLNYLESNGALPKELKRVIDYVDIIAMDLKLPSSTQTGELWDRHRKFLKIAQRKEVFLKAVISISTEEGDLNKSLDLIKDSRQHMALVLQPNSYEDSEGLQKKMERFRQLCSQANVAAWIIPQMHKDMGIK